MHFNDYKAIRGDGRIPAHLALHWTRRRLDLLERTERLQFSWAMRYGQCHEARWRQEGFDLRATLIDDPDGWFAFGIDEYGEFCNRWQPGAVRHWRGDSRCFRWFVPAKPNKRHEAYHRACDYGHGWGYVGIQVEASRKNVPLATETQWGIESDADVEYFTETALELACQVLDQARSTLHRLCGCGAES